jgi:hypothetical protein
MNIEWFLNMLLRDLANLWEQVIQGLMPVTGYFDWILAARLVLTLILCGLIGLERSGHESATGFRPHILVGLGACLMTMAGIYALPESSSMRDPMRVASYVVSGIGFLGAGAILRHGAIVQGVTTAASIWGCAGIGIAVGAGWNASHFFHYAGAVYLGCVGVGGGALDSAGKRKVFEHSPQRCQPSSRKSSNGIEPAWGKGEKSECCAG